MARRKQFIIADGATATPTITVDGSYPVSPGWIDYEGGNGSFFAVGTFGGGSAALQIQAPDGATWVNIGAGVTFTANGVGGFTAPAGRLRVTLSGSTAPSLKAWVVSIPTNEGG
jgi:hypothetical protein